MLSKLLSLFGPSLIRKIASPGQLASLARTILKFAGGFLTSLGFSEAAVGGFVAGNESIVAGLLSLAAGAVFSLFAEKKKKDE